MFTGNVASRTSYTRELRKRLGCTVSRTPRLSLQNPTRWRTRLPATARPRNSPDAPRWHSRCAEMRQKRKLAFASAKVQPNGTIWNTVQLPEIRAAVALYHDQPATSVDQLASASPYERSYIEAIYLRGLAYLRLRKGTEAAAEFQKIVDHKGWSWGATWVHPNWGLYYSLSYLGLARAFALMGDSAKSKKAFEDFFGLWKTADPELPILKRAGVEYSRLG